MSKSAPAFFPIEPGTFDRNVQAPFRCRTTGFNTSVSPMVCSYSLQCYHGFTRVNLFRKEPLLPMSPFECQILSFIYNEKSCSQNYVLFHFSRKIDVDAGTLLLHALCERGLLSISSMGLLSCTSLGFLELFRHKSFLKIQRRKHRLILIQLLMSIISLYPLFASAITSFLKAVFHGV